MPPSTSTRENALANIKTTLEAVVSGSSYNYTMDEVHRIDGPFFSYLEFVAGDTVAFIEEGQSSWVRETQGGLHLVTVEVFVSVARRYQPPPDNPLLYTTENKSTIRSKLIADVVRALEADYIRGGYAKRGFYPTDDGPQNLDYLDEGEDGPVWILEPWVAHEIRFEMAMEVDESAP